MINDDQSFAIALALIVVIAVIASYTMIKITEIRAAVDMQECIQAKELTNEDRGAN